MSSDAAVCRRSWIVVPSTPASRVASIHPDRARKLVFVHTPPVGLGNRYPPGAVPATRSRTYPSSAAGTGTVRVWWVFVGPNTAPLVRLDCVAARCTRTPSPCGAVSYTHLTLPTIY